MKLIRQYYHESKLYKAGSEVDFPKEIMKKLQERGFFEKKDEPKKPEEPKATEEKKDEPKE